MNCIIIAGANGEIGKEFVNKFLSKNKIIAISRQNISEINHPNLTSVVVDLTDPESLEKSFSDFDPLQYKKIIFIHSNVSSTITKSALKVRPRADTTYWLTPKEVVERSWKKILFQWGRYKEIDIYKKDPKFNKNYYFDDRAVFDKWAKYVWGK